MISKIRIQRSSYRAAPHRARAIMVTGIAKRSVKAIILSACCFVAFAYIGWRLSLGSGEFRLDKGYKVDIVVKGPDGKIIPAIGRAPQ